MKVGPKYKIGRRLGGDVFEKTQTQKYLLSEAKKLKTTIKGKRRKSFSDYGKELREKQRVRFTYGLSERQFKNMVKEAVLQKTRDRAEVLFENLESRLDNVIYRIGFAPTRRMARQMVSHGHITVNGRKVTIPSYEVLEGNKVGIKEGSLSKGMFVTLDDRVREGGATPTWMKLDMGKREALIQGKPKLNPKESTLDFSTVIEFYSK